MSNEAWGDGDDGPNWKDDAIENGWWDPDDVSQAFKDIFLERDRQVAEEGFTAEQDDLNTRGEMALAAACYAVHGCNGHPVYSDGKGSLIRSVWPWGAMWWKPKDRRRDLVRAAALIVAEIERLDRAAVPEGRVDG
ncbi:hypothetical protein B5P46_11760 [Rhizobium leguminosarum]|uniref:Uncharacterized protein n=1 Tax=Rhizobium leguminosarum TaxID=384 RepID=A0A4Q1UCN8_RHILE|nr:hypothetical protein [Rhizobium leguminosarum]RXT29351.1 hypothetical protein B5P46_11760 [Rhizobium leguminosarum]